MALSIPAFIRQNVPGGWPFLLLTLSILIQAFTAVYAKLVAGFFDTQLPPSNSFLIILYGGMIVFMGLQAVIWQHALVYYPLSFAYPFRSIVYFFVLVLSFLLFQESITLPNIAGLLIISAGIYVLVH